MGLWGFLAVVVIVAGIVQLYKINKNKECCQGDKCNKDDKK